MTHLLEWVKGRRMVQVVEVVSIAGQRMVGFIQRAAGELFNCVVSKWRVNNCIQSFPVPFTHCLNYMAIGLFVLQRNSLITFNIE